MSFIRNWAKEDKSIQAFGINIGAKVGFSFVDPELIK